MTDSKSDPCGVGHPDEARLRQLIAMWRGIADLSSIRAVAGAKYQCADDLEALLVRQPVPPPGAVPAAPQEAVPVKPFKQWPNSKYAGDGVGAAGPFRVVLRTDRKTAETYIELLHDDDAGGYGFTKRQARDLIPLLQVAVDRLATRLQQAAVPAAQDAEGQELCECGHVADEHGNDGTGHCGASRACRAGGCKQFKAASAPSRQEPPHER